MDTGERENTDYIEQIKKGEVDYGKEAYYYGAFRPGLPDSFYDKIEKLFVKFSGKKVLDIATGPGHLAFAIAARGAEVTGIDIAPGQVAEAKRLSTVKNIKCNFYVAPAENTGQPDHSLDVVVVGTAWHWFDFKAACQEVKRILVPGGLLIIVNYMYLVKHSTLVRDTIDLVMKYHPSWGFGDLDGNYPELVDPLVLAGKFELVEQFSYDYDQPFSHEGWIGRIQTCSGVGSGSSIIGDKLDQFNADLAKILKEKYPAEPVQVPHRIWCVVVRSPVNK